MDEAREQRLTLAIDDREAFEPEVERGLDGFDGLSSSEPTSTPVIFPAASRVGTRGGDDLLAR